MRWDRLGCFVWQCVASLCVRLLWFALRCFELRLGCIVLLWIACGVPESGVPETETFAIQQIRKYDCAASNKNTIAFYTERCNGSQMAFQFVVMVILKMSRIRQNRAAKRTVPSTMSTAIFLLQCKDNQGDSDFMAVAILIFCESHTFGNSIVRPRKQKKRSAMFAET